MTDAPSPGLRELLASLEEAQAADKTDHLHELVRLLDKEATKRGRLAAIAHLRAALASVTGAAEMHECPWCKNLHPFAQGAGAAEPGGLDVETLARAIEEVDTLTFLGHNNEPFDSTGYAAALLARLREQKP